MRSLSREAEALGRLEESFAAGGQGLVDGGGGAVAAEGVDVLREPFHRDRLAAFQEGLQGVAVGQGGEFSTCLDLKEGRARSGRVAGVWSRC